MIEFDHKRTAVLSLDVQNALVESTPGISEMGTIRHISQLLSAARRSEVVVMHVTASARPDYRDIPKSSPLWISMRRQATMTIGTPGAEIHPSAAALPDELIFNKSCVDPFLTTGLGQALNNFDINTLMLGGLWTNFVVEATARHASDMGYTVLIVRECCASKTPEDHEFAISRILPMVGYVVSIDDVLSTIA